MVAIPTACKMNSRTALIASSDLSFRQRLRKTLSGFRWNVSEAGGAAEAWTEVENSVPEAMIVDAWLPDIDQPEFLSSFQARYPGVDLLVAGGDVVPNNSRSPHRQELLYALNQSQDADTAASNASYIPNGNGIARQIHMKSPDSVRSDSLEKASPSLSDAAKTRNQPPASRAALEQRLPELIGDASCMLEVSRRIRLVAPRNTPVLIEGPTGSGKELVAEALHRLSSRNRKPFVAINCAAIPEALLEAELFGHTRGAFTGAVQGRVGRIEAADGGTLFLDEIGEMPLALQAKLLRFVECGELQRIGDNESLKVDVRIVAATHRPLAQQTQTGAFRADLYYRLAVFLIRTPSLQDHIEDLPSLVAHFLTQMGRQSPVKQIDSAALAKLAAHSWPGNVRELEHVLERASILAGDSVTLTSLEIDFGTTVN